MSKQLLKKEKELLEKHSSSLVEILVKKKCKVKRTIPLLFVCGGKLNDNNYLRYHFFEWMKQNWAINEQYTFISELALEHFVKNNQVLPDLMIVEQVIADFVDCVIIFPESAGSYAELGFFVNEANKKIACKTIIVDDSKYIYSESFISRGPKYYAQKCLHQFEYSYLLDTSNPEKTFNAIKNKVVESCSKRYSKTLKPDIFVTKAKKYENTEDDVLKVYLLLYIIHHYKEASLSLILETLKKVRKEENKRYRINQDSILLYMSILIGDEYIKEKYCIEDTRFYEINKIKINNISNLFEQSQKTKEIEEGIDNIMSYTDLSSIPSL